MLAARIHGLASLALVVLCIVISMQGGWAQESGSESHPAIPAAGHANASGKSVGACFVYRMKGFFTDKNLIVSVACTRNTWAAM